MLHIDLARSYSRLNKERKILIYDKNKLLSSEPFTSYGDAMVAIVYSRNSTAARRTINTGKLVGGRYTFCASPKITKLKFLKKIISSWAYVPPHLKYFVEFKLNFDHERCR